MNHNAGSIAVRHLLVRHLSNGRRLQRISRRQEAVVEDEDAGHLPQAHLHGFESQVPRHRPSGGPTENKNVKPNRVRIAFAIIKFRKPVIPSRLRATRAQRAISSEQSTTALRYDLVTIEHSDVQTLNKHTAAVLRSGAACPNAMRVRAPYSAMARIPAHSGPAPIAYMCASKLGRVGLLCAWQRCAGGRGFL